MLVDSKVQKFLFKFVFSTAEQNIPQNFWSEQLRTSKLASTASQRKVQRLILANEKLPSKFHGSIIYY